MSGANAGSQANIPGGLQSRSAHKVLHVLDHSLPLHSGYAFRTHNLLKCQLQRGWEPIAITSSRQEKNWNEQSSEYETFDGIRYYRSGAYSKGRFALGTELHSHISLYRRLRLVIAKEKPQLLHVHSPVVIALPAIRLARRFGIPIIYEVHAFWEDAAVDRGTYTERSLTYKTMRAAETWVCKHASHVVVLCQGVMQDLITRGLPPSKLHVASNGINLEEFEGSLPDQEFEIQWGLQGKILIGFTGSFYHYEGLELLLEVFSDLAKERHDLVLLLVGGGDMEWMLKRKSKLLGIESRVIFPGRIPHEKVPGVYALMDVVIFPRYPMRLTELVTPLKPFEAMAMKKVVVASDVGGHRELIRHDETGILFKAGDAESLKKSLELALDDKPLIRRLTENAFRWVCEERQWKKTTKIYDEIYDRTLGPSRRITRILYHHRTQMEDAQGIHIQEMISAFRQLGPEVEIVGLIRRGESQAEEPGSNPWRWLAKHAPNWFYEVMELGYNLYGFAALVRKIFKRKPDLIYERYSLHTFCGILASRFFRIPLILEVNAPLFLEQEQLGKLSFKRLAALSERWIASNSTKTVVVTHVMKEILQKEGVPGRKITVMTNGINPDEFHPNISGDIIRQRYQLQGALVVGFVGWFRPWHGLDMLLELMVKARLADKNVRLLLVGDGPALPELEEYAQKNNLHSAVVFTGPIARDQIAAHIAAMDVAVQPKVNQYACPMKILEYMAMSRCIVAPDQPNVREILENGVNASLFLPGDQEHFKETLLSVILDPSLRIALGKAAYETLVRKKFFWTENARRTIQLVAEGARDTSSEAFDSGELAGPAPD